MIPAPGRMVDIGGGQRMHVYERGPGEGPVVILEAGICASSLNWRGLQDRLSGWARVVAYDRAGLGWSDAASSPRTPVNLARELRAMLDAAEIRGPYVMVAHSFGSFVAHCFAGLYRSDVAGVILIDPCQAQEWAPHSERGRKEIRRGLRMARLAEALARVGLMRLAFSQLPDAGGSMPGLLRRLTDQTRKMPGEVWPAVAEHWSRPQFYRTAQAYLKALPGVAREMAGFEKIEGVPVTAILTRGGADVVAEYRQIRAERSGHWVHLDEPELVTDAIRQMVANSVSIR